MLWTRQENRERGEHLRREGTTSHGGERTRFWGSARFKGGVSGW